MQVNRVRFDIYFLIYLVISVHMIRGNINNKFRFIKDSYLSGYTCPDEQVLPITGKRSMSQCLAICADSAECDGVFRHQETCVGCKAKYLSKDDAPRLNGTTYYKRQSSSYLLVTNKMPWLNAKNHCAELGGHLVDIKTEWEHMFIKTLTDSIVWLGATDLANEGSFVWEDGSRVDNFFTNWGDDQPSSDNEHCVVLMSMLDPIWNDISCDRHFASVCEFDLK